MLLRRQELLAEGEERDELAAQDPGVTESLREKNHLGDELKVWHRHGDGSEELLEVIREFASPAVPFTRRVQRDEDARVLVNIDVFPEESHGIQSRLERGLDGLNLRRHRGEHLLFQAVKLVETTPRTALEQAGEDATHGLEVELLVAVEHQHLSAHSLTQRLDRFRLARARGSVRVTPVPEVHALRQRQVALISQRGVHEPRRVALVLVAVRERAVVHPDLHPA